MTTIAQVLTTAQQQLTGGDCVVGNARLDAEILLAFVMGRDRTYLFTWPEQEVTTDQQSQFAKLFGRRVCGEPIAYITGKKEFWSLPLEVNTSTLIPRPETELLVELALQKFSYGNAANSALDVFDLGTGTGAIALALAKEKPKWKVFACDVKPEVIQLAERNAQALNIKNIIFFVSDWFSCVGTEIKNQSFDLVISNPPYIDPADVHLSEGDVRFEPGSALVSGNHGLADIEKIIKQSSNYLKERGWLMLEHGFAQGAAVRILLKNFSYHAIETFPDIAGKERVTIGQKEFTSQQPGSEHHG